MNTNPHRLFLPALLFCASIATLAAAQPAAPPIGPGGRGAMGPGPRAGMMGEPPVLPPITSVTVDAHGQFIVNGKPFFPILIYDAPTDAQGISKMHDAGFNVATVSKLPDVVNMPTRGMYAAIGAPTQPINLGGVLLAMGVDSPAENYKKDMVEMTKAENAKIAAKIPGRPVISAIGYWADEPKGVKENTILGKDKYEDVVGAIDVAGPYLYPIPYQPVSSVGDAVARARAVSAAKPIVPILQIFVWDAKDRYPTPAELRCMVFESLIEGANGIGYYSYSSVTGQVGKNFATAQPVLWAAVKLINADLYRTAMLLLSGTPTKVETAETDAAIKVRGAKTPSGATVVVIANTSADPKTVTLKGVGNVTSTDTGVTVTPAGDDVTVKLAPFAAGTLAPQRHMAAPGNSR